MVARKQPAAAKKPSVNNSEKEKQSTGFRLSGLRVDPESVTKGKWDTTPFGFKLLIARINNPAYNRLWQRVTLDNAARLRVDPRHDNEDVEHYNQRLDAAVALENDLQGQVLAETILLGWDGLLDDDGQPIPYSIDRATTILNDPELLDLRNYVVRVASDFERYRLNNVDEALRAVKPQ